MSTQAVTSIISGTDREKVTQTQIERYVSGCMLELGIPAHLRGYYYLREAIVLTAMDMELVGSVTKLLYPGIARSNHTNVQRVERAIRNAIEVSWERGNPAVFEELFGYSGATGALRPTNSEYIARIADKVRLDLLLSPSLAAMHREEYE